MRRAAPLLLVGGLLAVGLNLMSFAPPATSDAFMGVFWQPDCQSAARLSDYRVLGAQLLLVQWTAVDQEDFSGQGESNCQVDWAEVQRRSGHLPLVLGLAGAYDPKPADLPRLAEQSRLLVARLGSLALQPAPAGYYAPVELRPDWPAQQVHAYLSALPRPLWVSAYAGKGQYGPAFVQWLQEAVPEDVHLLIQDGAGVGYATPQQAAGVVRALRAARGPQTGVIMEVFRKVAGSSQFRSALPWELSEQFAAYQDLPRYAFDGGHYMSERWIRIFLLYRWLRQGLSHDAPAPLRQLSTSAPPTPVVALALPRSR